MNVGQTDLSLTVEPLEDVDCFKSLESHVTADGGCKINVI